MNPNDPTQGGGMPGAPVDPNAPVAPTQDVPTEPVVPPAEAPTVPQEPVVPPAPVEPTPGPAVPEQPGGTPNAY